MFTTVRLSLRIHPSLHDKLEAFSEDMALPKNSICALALLEFFKKHNIDLSPEAAKEMLQDMIATL